MTPTDPTAWAVYGRKTGALLDIFTDEETAHDLADYYDVVPLYRAPTPPADDVRLATIRAFSEAAYGTDAIATRADRFLREFEVRPRGTVTDAAHDRDGMMICRKCGEGLTALDVIDGEKPCPGPRGTVTDAEVNRVQEAAGERGVFMQDWQVRVILEEARNA